MSANTNWPLHHDAAIAAIRAEAFQAREKFATFNSAHEGVSVLREEFEELWDEVKADNLELAIAEAVQVGAMAVRFVADMRAKLAASEASKVCGHVASQSLLIPAGTTCVLQAGHDCNHASAYPYAARWEWTK